MSQEFTAKTNQDIEAYIQQSMPEEERAAFEKRMKEEDLLKQEVLLQQSIHQAFDEKDWSIERHPNENEEIEKLTAKLNSEEYKSASQNISNAGNAYFDGLENKAVVKKRFSFYKVGIAATILLLISIPFLWPDDSLESQYVALAQWDDVPSLVEKGATANTTIKGEELFRAQKYDEVVNHFSANDTLSPYSMMYLGISYLELNQTEKALQIFDELLATKTIESSRAYWYKLLVYLKEDDKEKVRETLAIILSSEENYNYKKALSLAEELEIE